jgi:hypothetical protein
MRPPSQMIRQYVIHNSLLVTPICMPTDPKDPAVKAATQRREAESGKKDSEIGFGGTIVDIGDKDAEGVGAGK